MVLPYTKQDSILRPVNTMRIWLLTGFLLLCCVGLPLLYAAEMRDSQLQLEVLLRKANYLRLQSAEGFHLKQLSLPVEYDLTSPLTISLVNAEAESYYTFLDRIAGEDDLPLEQEDQAALTVPFREFSWEKTHLVCQEKYKVYDINTFRTLQEAQEIAKQEGIPQNRIETLYYPNTQVKITDGKGSTHYMELPIEVESSAHWQFMDEDWTYPGILLVKPSGKTMNAVNLVNLEDYIAGVVPNEIGNAAPTEALKAQAVAARTLTISKLIMNRHQVDDCDLCNTTHCQVYKGDYLKTPAILASVDDTAGEIMVCNEQLVDAVYSSSSGGKTEENEFIWQGKPLPFLRSVNSFEGVEEYDLTKDEDAKKWIDYDPQMKISGANAASWEKKTQYWEKTITNSELMAKTDIGTIQHIRIGKRGKSGRIGNITLEGSKGNYTIKEEYKIRQFFGNIPSSFFYFASEDPWVLHGKGSGHGVGLCQVGTLQLARKGIGYRAILKRYYTDIELIELEVFQE